jgi:predicted MPP superfamily phosphohydrolase
MENEKLTRRGFLKLSLTAAGEAALILLGGVGYARIIEPGWEIVTELALTLPRLPFAFHGYRIVQISDIHIGTWMNQRRLAKVIDTVNQLNPDLVVITGDFVYYDIEENADELISPLSGIDAKDGTLAILGNHDYWTNPGMVREIIKSAGILDISNAVQTLERDNSLLHIAGVDDYWEHKDRLDLVLDALPLEGAAILLAHEPDYADISANARRFDLQLSGHSHGGQVILPFLGPPILPLYGRKYPMGLYQVRNMLQYTNRGIGVIPPAIRFNCRPEITALTIHSPGV